MRCGPSGPARRSRWGRGGGAPTQGTAGGSAAEDAGRERSEHEYRVARSKEVSAASFLRSENLVAVQNGGLGQAAEAFLDGFGPGGAYALDVVEVVDGGPHDPLEAPEPSHDVLDDLLGQAGDP